MRKTKKVVGFILVALMMMFPYGMIVMGDILDELQVGEKLVDVFDVFTMVAFVILLVLNAAMVIVWTITEKDGECLLFWSMLLRIANLPFDMIAALFVIVYLLLWSVADHEGGGQLLLLWIAFMIAPCVYGIMGNILASKQGYLRSGMGALFCIFQFVPGASFVCSIVSYCMVSAQRRKQQQNMFV